MLSNVMQLRIPYHTYRAVYATLIPFLRFVHSPSSCTAYKKL